MRRKLGGCERLESAPSPSAKAEEVLLRATAHSVVRPSWLHDRQTVARQAPPGRSKCLRSKCVDVSDCTTLVSSPTTVVSSRTVAVSLRPRLCLFPNRRQQHEIGRVSRATSAVSPGTGGRNPRTGGVSPRTSGVRPRTSGVSPRTGGVSPRSGGVSPRTGGVRSRTAAVSAGSSGLSCSTAGIYIHRRPKSANALIGPYPPGRTGFQPVWAGIPASQSPRQRIPPTRKTTPTSSI